MCDIYILKRTTYFKRVVLQRVSITLLLKKKVSITLLLLDEELFRKVGNKLFLIAVFGYHHIMFTWNKSQTLPN